MPKGASTKTPFYRPRNPELSPFYTIVRDYFNEFEEVYPKRYGLRFGFWRQVIREAIDKFLECGDPHYGFARVRCPECGEQFFVALECGSYCTAFALRVTLVLREHFSAAMLECRSRVLEQVLTLIICPVGHKYAAGPPLRNGLAACAITLCHLFGRKTAAVAQPHVTALQAICAADFVYAHPIKGLALPRAHGFAIRRRNSMTTAGFSPAFYRR